MSRTVRLLSLKSLAPGCAKRVLVEGHQIAVVRIGNKVYGIGDRCSHANFSLCEGEVLTDACRLECPKHGSAFSLVTGEPDSLPAFKAVPVYRVRVERGDIVVDFEEKQS